MELRTPSGTLVLPPPAAPPETRAPFVPEGELLFIAATGSSAFRGPLDRQTGGATGRRAAEAAGASLLSVLEEALGSLDRVAAILRVTVLVACADGFSDLNRIADGVSDVLTDALGARGVHTRTVLGVRSLLGGLSVMCDAVVVTRRCRAGEL